MARALFWRQVRFVYLHQGIMLLKDLAYVLYSFERLRDIKTELDPYNVFRWPQSM